MKISEQKVVHPVKESAISWHISCIVVAISPGERLIIQKVRCQIVTVRHTFQYFIYVTFKIVYNPVFFN